ncbi:MAG: DEAD/DEAH box helicase [Candidatus Sericytochromatia bacterium]|nr:DEAD/DEAH box helicase [Candidatus Sericytochromatia bacterium]
METPTAFAEWELRPELLAGLAAQNLTVPTPIQQAAFPVVMAGRDVLAQSQTGTGKTLAFGLPLLQRLEPESPPRVEILIVLPTRELAMQVALSLGKLARPLGTEVAALFGGGSYRDQLRAIANGARLVVGTPGRLVDHLERGRLDLSACTTLVLDEADEMLDMGFAEELDKILAALPTERQSLLFSATMAPGTKALAEKTLREPSEITISRGERSAPEITHQAFEVFSDQKIEALVNVLHVEQPGLAIVFCHTKVETEQIAERLREEGFSAGYLNGDLPQEARTRTLNAFRRSLIDILVATDVAARGIDVKGISHVFNLGVPRDPDTYTHRVGRTGRAGAKGVAITFVPPRDAARFRRMLLQAGVKVELRPLPQAADVRKRLREAFHETLSARIANGPDLELASLAGELLAYIDSQDLVVALLAGNDAAKAAMTAGANLMVPRKPEVKTRSALREKPSGTKEKPQDRREKTTSKKAPRREVSPIKESGGREPRRLSEHHEPGFSRVWLNQGKSHGLTRGALVKLVCGAGGVSGSAIGAIAIHPFFSFFDVVETQAPRVVQQLNGLQQRGRAIKANLVPPVQG